MSLVTAPAVPLPTLFTAAACALVAAAPVTAFSAFSCAAVPCGGPLNAGGSFVVDALWVVVVAVCDVAAPAMAEPPRASAASAAIPTTAFLMGLNILSVLSMVRLSGVTDHGARPV